jgi:hypothetical protein
MLAGETGGLGKSPVNSPEVKRGMKNFLDALAAVLAGNAIYYLLMPHLAAVARHRLFREDWGLLVDFAICAAIFVAVKYVKRRER